MGLVFEQIVLILLSGGLGFSIGMMVSPIVKKEVERIFGAPEPPEQSTDFRTSEPPEQTTKFHRTCPSDQESRHS